MVGTDSYCVGDSPASAVDVTRRVDVVVLLARAIDVKTSKTATICSLRYKENAEN